MRPRASASAPSTPYLCPARIPTTPSAPPQRRARRRFRRRPHPEVSAGARFDAHASSTSAWMSLGWVGLRRGRTVCRLTLLPPLLTSSVSPVAKKTMRRCRVHRRTGMFSRWQSQHSPLKIHISCGRPTNRWRKSRCREVVIGTDNLRARTTARCGLRPRRPRNRRGTHFIEAVAEQHDTVLYLRVCRSGGGTRTHDLRINSPLGTCCFLVCHAR